MNTYHAGLVETRLVERHAKRQRRSLTVCRSDEPREAGPAGNGCARQPIVAALLVATAAVGLLVLALVGLWAAAPTSSSFTWPSLEPASCSPGDPVLPVVREVDGRASRFGPAYSC